jgi:hypothetical protein
VTKLRAAPPFRVARVDPSDAIMRPEIGAPLQITVTLVYSRGGCIVLSGDAVQSDSGGLLSAAKVAGDLRWKLDTRG